MPKKSGGGKPPETSSRVSAYAAKGLAGGKLTPTQQKSVYASALRQDTTPKKPK